MGFKKDDIKDQANKIENDWDLYESDVWMCKRGLCNIKRVLDGGNGINDAYFRDLDANIARANIAMQWQTCKM